MVVVEKEQALARHQSGRNSGVLHSGIYYRPGSLKARTAVEGRLAMERYCEERDVPYERCGKVIVATDAREAGRLDELVTRAAANGVRAERIGPERLRELEPHAGGLGALHVLDTGIVDFAAVSTVLGVDLQERGASVRCGVEVQRLREGDAEVVVETTAGPLVAAHVVNCGGLQSDLLAADALGPRPDVRIVPFRGEFHDVVGPRRHLVRNLIYPVPLPELPFLGAHLSRGIDGGVHAGPNAVLALAREGYTWHHVDRRDLRGLLAFPGFWRLARRYWRTGAVEVYQSLSRRALAHALQRLVPEIGVDDLVPRPAGVRAQALGRDGSLLDDFVVRETARAVHVLNAPSPAATASLVIGDTIAERIVARS